MSVFLLPFSRTSAVSLQIFFFLWLQLILNVNCPLVLTAAARTRSCCVMSITVCLVIPGQGDGLSQGLLLDWILDRRGSEQCHPEGGAHAGRKQGKIKSAKQHKNTLFMMPPLTNLQQ